jgi:PAS domain-containing protein
MTITKFHEHLPQILDSLGVGVVIIDRSNRHIVYANKKMSEIINVPNEEILGKECSNFICPTKYAPMPIKTRQRTAKYAFVWMDQATKSPSPKM